MAFAVLVEGGHVLEGRPIIFLQSASWLTQGLTRLGTELHEVWPVPGRLITVAGGAGGGGSSGRPLPPARRLVLPRPEVPVPYAAIGRAGLFPGRRIFRGIAVSSSGWASGSSGSFCPVVDDVRSVAYQEPAGSLRPCLTPGTPGVRAHLQLHTGSEQLHRPGRKLESPSDENGGGFVRTWCRNSSAVQSLVTCSGPCR